MLSKNSIQKLLKLYFLKILNEIKLISNILFLLQM